MQDGSNEAQKAVYYYIFYSAHKKYRELLNKFRTVEGERFGSLHTAISQAADGSQLTTRHI
jgi:hypothetical protein